MAAATLIREGSIDDLDLGVEIDDDASEAYREIGLPFDWSSDHPFAQMELERWRHCRLVFARVDDRDVDFLALGHADGKPHLEQLAVRRAFMQRGIGTALLRHAIDWSRTDGELWITTYEHVAWNAPWYARFGFVAVPDGAAPREIRDVLAAARAVLPEGNRQIAMVMRHTGKNL